jgi:hypothetical protein
MHFPDSHKILLKPILILLVCCFFTVANAGDGVIDHAAVDKRTGGQPTVGIDSVAQTKSGLKTLLAESVQHQAEFEAMGKVISIQPLLALKERYLIAQAELGGAKARLKQSAQSLKRQQDLFRHGISAKRSLQEHEALGSADQAALDADHARLVAIANEARLLWGKTLAEWALSNKADRLNDFLTGGRHLLQITLPANKQLASEIDTITIEPSGQRSKARSATLISRATLVENAIQGESYFFQANGDGLGIGMKVTAWIPEPRWGETGVIVPESALVWYMDQVYVYIKTAKDRFTRRAITSFSAVPEGYFVKQGISAGEEVVSTGGQMLLSEELRGRVPDED